MNEKPIENSILSYLAMKKIFAWKNETTGIYDPKIGRFRKKRSVHHMTGVSDILGIYQGRFLAIEVKKPKFGKQKKTYPTPNQRAFIERVRENGGIAFVARSVDDVRDYLNKLSNKETNQ